ncbi:MAG: hydantoinase/oxoprolinase family protein [Veillonella sp.]|uniref:hydantoinase/oxoprolinase family protein n=1 Tax=Veillonella sp. TaxID=1926307 RepID=UPI002902446C|nr:hydantoinase/oxoprolinase family protein [Veillonella sp.]MDU2061269.1 hydantoinase/oxoprolinase family protein [Veillonella sp.]MDU2076496.1 hydantoinase/oxoprolinase family protein [Veillonella sp.]MDU2101242.1 hydantoinase/oxoprolinase family protein [Veillonella sp.]MDU2117048.1 hydantoinase/oxoprolinase family protein [Veillonella sp.]
MLLGLDVGGTFTDAVIIDGHRVVATAKRRTTKDNLMNGIGEALDAVLEGYDTSNIEQVTLSTTVVTNTIVEEKEQVVDLYVVTGPGRNVDDIFPVKPIYLQGYTDHRGIVVERTPADAVRGIANMVQTRSGTDLAAVSAKFGGRNPQEELSITEELKNTYHAISNGSLLSGSLNFPRRTISAYFNSAVTPVFTVFKKNVEDALSARNIVAPLHILKADGGSLPVEHMVSRPVETAFTGPAATVLGLSALGVIGNQHTVALDIGGTTTDISLWKHSRPLMTKNGVSIREYPSAVRSFAVTSVGIGGESVVRLKNGNLTVGPERVGPSVALGGVEPTLGDALIVLGHANYGDFNLASRALQDLADAIQAALQSNNINTSNNQLTLIKTASDVAKLILQNALETIQRGVDEVITVENKRPIYVVADIVNPDIFVPEHIVVVGGTAPSLGASIGEYMDLPITIPENAAVANAIGAALALSTIELTVHVDTKRRLLVIPELGIKQQNCTLKRAEQVVERVKEALSEEALRLGLDTAQEIEIISIEDFPVVEGWQSMERLITVKVQLAAGVKHYVE